MLELFEVISSFEAMLAFEVMLCFEVMLAFQVMLGLFEVMLVLLTIDAKGSFNR